MSLYENTLTTLQSLTDELSTCEKQEDAGRPLTKHFQVGTSEQRKR